MFDLARYEGRHRVRASLALSVGLALLAAMVIWLYPSFTESVDLDSILEAYPEPVLAAFGIETMSTLGGFLAVELYNFAWVILLGLYLAYAAASLVADDVERGRTDLLLSLPVARSRVVLEKYLSLLVPVVVVNAVTLVVVFAGAGAIDRPIPVADLLAVHGLSVPYLLTTAGIGLFASVVFDRAGVAQRVAIGVVFALFLVESVLAGTDFEAVGTLAPMRYYDPTAILVNGEYDLAGGAILLVASAALVLASQFWFARKDLN